MVYVTIYCYSCSYNFSLWHHLKWLVVSFFLKAPRQNKSQRLKWGGQYSNIVINLKIVNQCSLLSNWPTLQTVIQFFHTHLLSRFFSPVITLQSTTDLLFYVLLERVEPVTSGWPFSWWEVASSFLAWLFKSYSTDGTDL